MSDELLAALVSGVLGVVTGFVLTWYGARKRRQAERESLRRELANSFLEKLGGATDATRKALDAQESGLAPEAAKERLERAEWLLGEVSARLTSVRVRLPADAGGAAREAVEELQRTAEHLGPPPASKEALKEAHKAFERARQADDRLVASLSDS